MGWGGCRLHGALLTIPLRPRRLESTRAQSGMQPSRRPLGRLRRCPLLGRARRGLSLPSRAPRGGGRLLGPRLVSRLWPRRRRRTRCLTGWAAGFDGGGGSEGF